MNSSKSHPRLPLARAALAWGGVAALALTLAAPWQAAAQKFKGDALEPLRKFLDKNSGREKFRRGLGDENDIDKVKAAADNYRQALEKVAALTNPGDLVKAMILPEWPLPTASELREDPAAKLAREALGLKEKADFEALGLADKADFSEVKRVIRYKEFRAGMSTFAKREAAEFLKSYEVQARAREGDVRRNVVAKRLKTALTAGPAARRVALYLLIQETMSGAWVLGGASEYVSLVDDLAEELILPLCEAARSAPEVEVRAAACRALGRFHLHADTAAKTLRANLAEANPEAVRVAAAEGLEGLVNSALGIPRLQRSEPGVSTGESKRGQQTVPQDVKTDVAAAVARAAPHGRDDASPAVRRQCILALQECASQILSVVTTRNVDERRPDEKGKANLTQRPLRELIPLIDALAAAGPAMRKAALDDDPVARLQARITIGVLAKALGRLRAAASRELGVLGIAAGDDAKTLEKSAGRLAASLTAAVKEITEAGFTDQSVASRRAAAEAGEALAAAVIANLDEAPERDKAAAKARVVEIGDLIVPPLSKALKDPDPFVRWISARALGRLARNPGDVVPALAGNFADDDIDARKAAILAVGKYGPEAASAAAALGAVLGKGDADVRLEVIKALDAIGQGGAPALAAIAGEFANPDPRVRSAAARLVGRFEKEARPHLDGLRKLLDDPDSDVRNAASNAILAIPDE